MIGPIPTLAIGLLVYVAIGAAFTLVIGVSKDALLPGLPDITGAEAAIAIASWPILLALLIFKAALSLRSGYKRGRS